MKQKLISLLLVLCLLAAMSLSGYAITPDSAVQILIENAIDFGEYKESLQEYYIGFERDIPKNGKEFYGWYYDELTDELVLSVETQNDDGAQGLYLSFDPETGALSENALYALIFIYADYSASNVYLDSKDLDRAAFTSAEGLNYRIDCAEGNETIVRQITEELFDEGMKVWDGMLRKELDMNMGDLGFTAYTDPSGCGHEETEQVTVIPATCTEDGIYDLVCTLCNETLDSGILPALGHELTGTALAALCEAPGNRSMWCTRCDYRESEDFPPLGHSFVCIDEKAPTETEAGFRFYACQNSPCERIYIDFLPVTGTPIQNLTDVKQSAWYYEAAEWAVSRTFITGIDSAFRATKKANRAMLATILYRMTCEPSVEGLENPFPDVKESNYFYKAALWANETGVITGSNGKFAPTVELSRETAATILYRYAENVLHLTTSCEGTVDLKAKFPDGDKVSSWAYEPMRWAVSNGLINGNKIDGVDMLDAKGKANRGQLAIILMNFCSIAKP